MRVHEIILGAVVLLAGVGAPAALGQDAPAAAEKKVADRWATPPAPRLPKSAKEFQPAADALPAHVKFVEGLPTATEHATKFWGDPAAKGLVDAPKDKHAFGLVAEGGKPGTVFVYEYAEELPGNLEAYLSLLLWLIEDYPTEGRPDQVLFTGRYAFVFSFPIADRGVEWFKSHLRKQFGVAAMTDDPARHGVYEALGVALGSEDPEAVLAAYGEHEAVASNDSFCRMAVARACRDLEDWPQAQTHYLAALALARSMADPLSNEDIFETLTWASYALMYQGKPAEAVEGFRSAKTFGIANGTPGSGVWGPYNVACALCMSGDLDGAAVELREAVEANAEIKAHAREDTDLEALRAREDIQKLLADDADGEGDDAEDAGE